MTNLSVQTLHFGGEESEGGTPSAVGLALSRRLTAANREMQSAHMQLQANNDWNAFASWMCAWTVARLEISTVVKAADQHGFPEIAQLGDDMEAVLGGADMRKNIAAMVDGYAVAMDAATHGAALNAGNVGALVREIRELKDLIAQPVIAERDKDGNIVRAIRKPVSSQLVKPSEPDFERMQAIVAAGHPAIAPLARGRVAVPEIGDAGKVCGALVTDLRTGGITVTRLAD